MTVSILTGFRREAALRPPAVGATVWPDAATAPLSTGIQWRPSHGS